MDAEPVPHTTHEQANDQVSDAPSPRAQALREEIFGTALTLDEAAYVLSLDRTTVAKYLRERTLVGFQIGREWLIPEEQLRAYVRRVYSGVAPGDREKQRAEDDAASSGGGWTRLDDAAPSRHLLGKLFSRGRDRERLEPSGDRFDKFTMRARRVLELAQEEAHRFGHNYIGTEHLLLGLIREGDGVAARVLSSMSVDLARVRSGVEFIIGRGDRPTVGEVGLTPRAKKVIELAVDEARRLGHRYIGTEHLLLGLVREGEGIAAGVLESLGVNLERLRAQILHVLQATIEGQAPPPPPEEAATLVAESEQVRICVRCDARNPLYFRYCFNCGTRLEDEGH